MNIKDEYFKLRLSQRLYCFSLFFLLLYFVSCITKSDGGSVLLLIVFSLFWIPAICVDLVELFNKIYQSTLGKALLLIMFSACTNFAIALSEQMVNDITGVDPSKFPHAVVLLTTLYIPVFLAFSLMLIGVVLVVFSPLLFAAQDALVNGFGEVIVPNYTRQPVPYKRTTELIQFISLVALAAIAYGIWSENNSAYANFLRSTSQGFIFNFEMHSKAPCPLEKEERAAFIADEIIVVAAKKSSEILFQARECKVKSE